MPRDAVVVHVVEHAEAGLGGAVDVELGIVGLGLLLVTGLGPRVVTPPVGDLQRDDMMLGGSIFYVTIMNVPGFIQEINCAFLVTKIPPRSCKISDNIANELFRLMLS